MTGWLEYDYVIASEPSQYEFPSLNGLIMSRIEMRPHHCLLHISPADACLIVLDDAQRPQCTADDHLYRLDGNRPDFDDWMAEHHPQIAYHWLDQWVVAFSDRAAQLSFDHDLGQRIVRSVYLRQSTR